MAAQSVTTPRKAKQKQANKTTLMKQTRGKVIAKGLIEGLTAKDAIIKAGYAESYATIHTDKILNNPIIQHGMNAVLERAGLTDDAIADKIKSLCNAKKTSYFADKGKVIDSRTDDDNAIQARSIELAAKLKGHLIDRSLNVNVHVEASPIDLSRWRNTDSIAKQGIELNSQVIDNTSNDDK